MYLNIIKISKEVGQSPQQITNCIHKHGRFKTGILLQAMDLRDVISYVNEKKLDVILPVDVLQCKKEYLTQIEKAQTELIINFLFTYYKQKRKCVVKYYYNNCNKRKSDCILLKNSKTLKRVDPLADNFAAIQKICRKLDFDVGVRRSELNVKFRMDNNVLLCKADGSEISFSDALVIKDKYSYPLKFINYC